MNELYNVHRYLIRHLLTLNDQFSELKRQTCQVNVLKRPLVIMISFLQHHKCKINKLILNLIKHIIYVYIIK